MAEPKHNRQMESMLKVGTECRSDLCWIRSLLISLSNLGRLLLLGSLHIAEKAAELCAAQNIVEKRAIPSALCHVLLGSSQSHKVSRECQTVQVLSEPMKPLTCGVSTWREENGVVGSQSFRSGLGNLVAKHPPFPFISSRGAPRSRLGDVTR